jgi:peptidyl-dipeptidase A
MKLLIILLSIVIVSALPRAANDADDEMRKILDQYNNDVSQICNRQVKASWAVQTDVGNRAKEEELTRMSIEYANFRKDRYEKDFKNADPNNYNDNLIKRQLTSIKEMGTALLSDEDLKNLTETKQRMAAIYNSARICPYEKRGNCDLDNEGWTLDPEIENRMAESTDYDELRYIWEEWHAVSGAKMRDDYKIYVELMNKAALANKYKDAGEMWRARYEDDKMMESAADLWFEIQPLYDELHKYVHRELAGIYGSKMENSGDMIPAFLLGNMWAQTWVHLYDRIKPFKDASSIDVTAKMLELNYNEYKMFEMSDEFYMSMGLPTSNMSFNGESIITKPKDRIIACHASAWDFCDGADFRIKMCTKINMEDFIVVHHEMGHIMYYILYKDQPLLLRGGANPAFHEAVGDTIALSVSTPKHLKKVNLLDNYEETEADNINALFKMALERVAFMPFGYLIDFWRWRVFSGETPEENWNEMWWMLREGLQKVTPVGTRNESFFDPGAKYHVPADSQYIAYFFAHILEFQFYRSLCIEAGEYDPNAPEKSPLHKCDFFNSKEAGKKLAEGLKLGTSEHWTVALEKLTGQKEVSGQALMEYFAPLYKYLQGANNDATIKPILEQYNKEASVAYNKLVKAEWAVATDTLNEKLQVEYDAAVLENAKFERDWYNKEFKNWHPDNFTDESNKRQIRLLTTLGLNALPDDQLSKLNKARTSMETIYNSAKICPFEEQDCNLAEKGLTLDPEIDSVLATSNNYDQLLYTWQAWHNASGKKMRNDYAEYVELVNAAAKLNNKNDYGQLWREDYEDEELEETLESMWKDVEPLYNELHKYVKNKLAKIYSQVDKNKDLIPAHILGNMWAQSWVNLYDRIKPFEGGSQIDVTSIMKDQNFTALKMFEMSDKFFMDLGLPPNDMSYDTAKGAIIEKPKDRVITCHASAWDFYDGEDFRIKMCTNINQEDFITVHHEMGHINYFILYKDQPVPFRTSANPAFHEAVGDLIALSVSTPAHLQKIGLLKDYKDTEEDNINALFKMALERVAFLPFGYLIDKWRWDVFSGKVPQNQWNAHWWALREKYQKVSAPVSRSEDDFDPGAKYHVPASSQYIAYFIAHVLEFQLHRDLCIEAGKYNPDDEKSEPLHKCDIDGSKAAGEKLRKGLSLGFSRHWSVALEEMTGKKVITGKAVREYFKPLEEYLIKVNNGSTGLYASMILMIACSAILKFLIN